MDHAEARELLDLAAAEAGGLDRLMAGDTPDAIALAGHLAGCDDCTEEFSRLRESSEVIRDVIATMPPADLRDRTLAFVAAVGRPRGVAAAGGMGSAATVDLPLPNASPVPPVTLVAFPGPPAPSVSTARRRGGRLRWLAAAAALVIVTAGVTGVVVSSAAAASARQASLELEGLTEVASWTVKLDRLPDVRHVILTASTPGGAMEPVGTLIFSPHTTELVVVADGMAQPAAGQEYRCWVEIDGARQRLGKMYMSGSLAYWVGDSAALTSVPAGSRFGVSIADTSNTGGGSPAILSGTLQAS